MKKIKYYRFQLLFELNKMIEIYEMEYKFCILKKTIERVENESNSHFLYVFVSSLNNVCKVFYNLSNDFSERQKKALTRNLFDQYLKYLNKCGFFAGINMIQEFNIEYRKDFQEKVLNHWNGTLTGSYGHDYLKSFIDVFDDMFENGLSKHPKVFVVNLKELKHLYRAVTENHFGDYDRMVPKEEFVKHKNRWNPEGVAFLYLGADYSLKKYDGTINWIEKTCFEELRLQENMDATVCQFIPENRESKILNFTFEEISFDDIDSNAQAFLDEISSTKVDKILSNIKFTRKMTKSKNLENEIWKVVHKEINNANIKEKITAEAELYLGKSIMKNIEEAVFLPVDEKENADQKEYIPFHYLSEYLIEKGFSGILYKSTRMNKIGLKGKNLVLFNKEDAVPKKGTMRVYHYDGKRYEKIEG